MYTNQYQHEYQVRAIIDTYHREAIQADRIRIAWTSRRNRIAAAAGSFRSTVRSLIA